MILVDDGIATGATVCAALAVLRLAEAGRIVVAAPVIAKDVYAALCRKADEVAAVILPVDFRSVGEWYEDFAQVTDQQVHTLLNSARLPPAAR